MSSYAIENHQLQFNEGLSTLYVINTDTSVQVASYDLSNVLKVETSEDDYVLNSASLSGNLFRQPFNPDTDDSFGITLREGIGVSDLRTTRSNFTYDLDECPIYLRNEDGPLCVYTACTGSCQEPSNTCCTVTPVS